MVVPTGGRILTKKSEAGGEGLALGLGLGLALGFGVPLHALVKSESPLKRMTKVARTTSARTREFMISVRHEIGTA